MVNITEAHLQKLIDIEETICYDVSPSKEQSPIIVEQRNSKILISAPHGARTYRNNSKDEWHQEDEYTAGLALLLGEICDVTPIATKARIDDHDPNYQRDDSFLYKKTLKEVAHDVGVRFVLDLHGAALRSENLDQSQLVDLGTGGNNKIVTLPEVNYNVIKETIEARIGSGTTDRNGKVGFPAAAKNRTITNYCHTTLGIHAIQIEMKPQVRVLQRRKSASLYPKHGEFQAEPQDVINMLQALVQIVERLKEEYDLSQKTN